ncbi:MAG: Crp/Fnr family transcriptional regulator [Bacteroidota bacterium]
MKNSTSLDFFKHFPLFNVLTEDEMNQLMSTVEFRKIKKYDYIYKIGDPSTDVFFLVKGIVKIGRHSDDGREVIKSILHPMAMFGELPLMGEKKRQDYAISMNEEVHLYTLKVSEFQRLIATNHQLCIAIMNYVGNRLREVENRLEDLVFKDARARIIDFIKESAEKRGRRVGFEMLFKHCLTQQDIANITGTSRQTVTSVLNELKRLDLIYFNRRSILIRDMAKLA